MKLDFEPSFSQHAKLAHRTDDDTGIPFRDMMAFSADALDTALEAEESVCFHHSDVSELVDWLRSERPGVSFGATGDMKSTNHIFFNGVGQAKIRVKEVAEDAVLLDRAANILRDSGVDVV